ncbi:CCA tRNA nucleotidyltransferase [Microcella alkaliphila]|uniref:tRNA adenylyltransferase n=1 Tax=Microcella alkaliphila TaxID=279828 RepID=A0A0U5BCY9_9MICO|nr:CCA tRNA nucleotidyltransferase [Microcella alkaliphila]BAU31086.1 tRNA adenylyltransferase [Microcella alkaliphila]
MESVAQAVSRLRELAAAEPLATLAQRFAAAGHELALVGGPVRDAFLGRGVHDLDLATSARPDDIIRIIRPVVDAHWDIGRDFGTIGARIGDDTVEITTYRADEYDPSSRKPEVAFGDTLEGDLLRRDFTINALALRLPQLELVDPTGGFDHLVAGLLVTPTTPERSFGDDPLRMLRGVRFAAQLGVTIDEAALQAMTAMRGRLEIISAERIRDELVKLLATASPRRGLELLVATGLADYVLPELPALRLEIDEHAHHKDVYEHSLTVLEQAIDLEQARGEKDAPADTILRLAALLHDIGKPATRKIEPNGAVTFHHHDVVGAKMAKKRLTALRFDKDTITAVARLIELHLRFFGYADAPWTDSGVRRYVRDAGPVIERLHILTRADVTTRNKRKAARLKNAYDELEQRIVELAEQEELAAIRPDLDGEQIMRILGLRPGPEVGAAYRYLLEVRLDEGPLAADVAEQRLRDWWSARGDDSR